MLKLKRIPKHIGIIPDGNRRWALAHGLPKEAGYDYGIEPGKRLLEEGLKLEIQEVSVYAFTLENTYRPKEQIIAFKNALLAFFDLIKDKDVSILVIGNTESRIFPKELKKFSIPEKDRNQKKRLNFLVNYSWKWDLNMIKKNCPEKDLKKQDLLHYIGSKDIPMIDMMIRWGNRRRLSGFLPVQSAYADIYIVETLWPDFKIEQFYEALKWYEKQDITLGG